MLHILFVTNKNVNPIIGGIERITHVLAKGFQDLYGYQCYSAFTQRLDNTPTIFQNEFLLEAGAEKENIEEIVKKNNIDFIIAQGSDARVNRIIDKIGEAVKDIPTCKLLFVFHNMPGFECVKMDLKVLWYRILHGQNIIYNCKYWGVQLFAPLLKWWMKSHLREKYLPAYKAADKVVLLTQGFIHRYASLADVPVDDRFVALGNAATFDKKLNMYDYDTVKQKEVLCVARFDERHKRVSLALKIWSQIEKRKEFSDWHLRIVGYGEDFDYNVDLAKKLNLNRVHFEGKKDSFEYYKKASIFMMTSAFEGFGLVLIEAQQMGAVPLAFNTYEAVYDIIENGTNGYIIDEGNMEDYARKLELLMRDIYLRKRMAAEGLKTIEKFSIETITKQWVELFEDLKKK